MQDKERAMFGKSKDDNDQLPSAIQQPPRPAAAKPAEPGSADQVSTISRGMTVVGKILGEGTLNVFGQVEGELRALNVLINEGARVEGDVVAEDLTIGGQVKGAIHASRLDDPSKRAFSSIDSERWKISPSTTAVLFSLTRRGQCCRPDAHPAEAPGRPR
jgi:hypothetical protein